MLHIARDNIKWILAFLATSLLICFGSVACMAETYSGSCGAQGDNVTWFLDDETWVLTISGEGEMANYGNVSQLAPWNKYRTEIKIIDIEEGVSHLGSQAFYNCTSLEKVIFPNSMQKIDGSAFYHSSYSFDIYITSKEMWCNLKYPNRNTVDALGHYGLYYNDELLTEFVVPDSVTAIGDYVFCYGNFNRIILHDNIKEIGRCAFYNCDNLVDVDIPNSVIIIGNGAFGNCSSLRNMELPNGLTNIPNELFYSCSNLCNVKIPESVEKIGSSAFSDCTSLTEIELPSKVTQIEDYAFYSSLNSQRVFIWGDNVSFGDNVFLHPPIIYCFEYSDADYWATDKGYEVVYLDGLDINSIRTISLPEDLRIACGEVQKIPFYAVPLYDNPEISWESSNTAIISIDNGIVEVHAPGIAIITVSVGSESRYLEITAYQSAYDFMIQDEVWVITKGDVQLTINNIVPEGSETNIIWSSSDEAIATVDENGLICGKKPGDAIITATDATGISKTCTAHVCYPVTEIDLQAPTTAYIGQEFQLTANVTMRTQTCVNHLVAFSSNDETVATVDENGVVRSLNFGTVEITAEAESGVSATCTITIKDADLILPVNLTTIESEAFANLSSTVAILVPETVTYIADDAFADSDVIIIAPAGSYAIQWAEEHNFTYVEK